MAECPHGEMVGMPCPPCDRDKAGPPEPERIAARVQASHESGCRHCGGWIALGDPIALLEIEGVWVHEGCAEREVAS